MKDLYKWLEIQLGLFSMKYNANKYGKIYNRKNILIIYDR